MASASPGPGAAPRVEEDGRPPAGGAPDFHSGYKLASTEHKTALSALGHKLEAIAREEAGNIVLDALTVHDSDWKRINRALKPATKKSKPSYFA
ncbi:hypothetical protein [Sorangium sp. So ce1024]|uniref:hypothetical protein n=1 Tax=unclassified Sorangium TaxID=2621164 RepID=UPI003F109A32